MRLLRYIPLLVLGLLLLARSADGFSARLPDLGRRYDAVDDAPSSLTSTTPIQVARARLPQDLDGIRQCRAAAFATNQAMRHSQRRFVNATAVAEGRSICLVARVKEPLSTGRVLGTADLKFRAADSSISINNVFVRPDARGRGIGKRLLEGIEKTAADQGARRLKLAVSTSNVPAVSLYRSYGYQPPGIHNLVAFIGEQTGVSLQIEMSKNLDD